MAISIKDEEADALARKAAIMTGKSLTEVITDSLRETVQRLEHERDKEKMKQEILAISRSVRQELEAEGIPFHSSDHADIYDEDGLPK